MKLAQLQQNYEAVVSMMREGEAERDELRTALDEAAAVHRDEAERLAAECEERISTCERQAEDERAEHAATLAELQERLAASDAALRAAQAAQASAEREVERLEREAAAASSRFEAAVAEQADAADVGRRKVEQELDQTRRSLAVEATRAAAMGAAREAALATALAEAEDECTLAAERGEALAARARERAAAADKAAEDYKDEMRRSVGAERQRVAGMLYKEALQTHTLEENERQIEELNVELADARESLREAKEDATAARRELAEKVAASATYDTQLLALSAAQAKKVSYIEELDERLAVEQATREEQARLIAQLQKSVTERTTKEAASATRAAEAEKALATLKQEARALRVAVRSANLKKVVAACQTERVEGPQMSVQTDFQSIQMPLPALPHGGMLLPRGK